MRTLVDEGDVDPQDLYVVKMPAAAPIHEKVRICFGEPKLEQGEEVVFGPSTRDQVQAFIDGFPYPLSEGSPSVDTMDPNESDRLRDQLKGQTVEHATPPRLEDEGQSGG